MPKYNLELYKTLININFAYIHSNPLESRARLPSIRNANLFNQLCAANLPVSFIFNFWSRDMSHDHN